MQQSKVISLLRSLSPKEIRRFDDFVHAAYFGATADVQALWRVLAAQAPDFPDAAIDRFEVMALAFPDRPLPSDVEISRLLNALLQLAEQFLAIEDLRQSPADAESRVLRAYQRHGLDKHFQASLRRVHRLMEEMPFRDEEWLHLRFIVAGAEARDQVHNQARAQDQSLQHMASVLDDYYFSTRLRLTCELVNRQNILSAQPEAQGLRALVQQLLAASADSSAPAVRIYAQLLRLLSEGEDSSHFDALRALMVAHKRILSLDNLRELYSYAQNYCIRRIRLGDSTFLRALFDLYQLLIHDGALLENQELSPWKYKNIASVGLQLGEYAWVEDFVTRYRPFLPEAFRDNAYAYNMADLAYHRGDYATALRTLVQVEFTDVFYSLDTRKMLLKIYYLQGATEPLISLIQAFRVYLRRNKLISETNRNAYSNFVHLTNALWKAQSTGEHAALLAQIDATQPLVEEAWLRKMAEELLG
jgi:hypothetical protein